MKKKAIYGILLVVGVVGLSLCAKPIQHMFFPYEIITTELKTELALNCQADAEKLYSGLGLYSESQTFCPSGFLKMELQCLSGLYCLKEEAYLKNKTVTQFAKVEK